ncbi:hypothetical protein OOK31_28735 [Streptomyces sp. NBC_00249]|uniref:hypothetical protein n=1 Tax=Streptomyces sp. NBC_00249 TaxID=2975690 RepID=UPI002251F8FB|nr:hypothetical protein [Streptomyces sp. NBC_00249]MCX5197829.1 hypothetical protein [Streptomyces sp. NBC_00249]
MRTRLVGFTAAVTLAVLGPVSPAAHAALAAPTPAPSIDGRTCEDGTGTVEYEPNTGTWVCVGGTHDGSPII